MIYAAGGEAGALAIPAREEQLLYSSATPAPPGQGSGVVR